MGEIKIRYTFKRKDDGHLWQSIWDITLMESGGAGFSVMMRNESWEIVARDRYIGLDDKNGNNIFEGDIVKVHQFLFDGNEVECETKGIVSYSSTSFTLSEIDSKFIEEYTGYAKGEGEFPIADFSPIDNLYGLHEESFEILGNIHLDDELLVSHTNT